MSKDHNKNTIHIDGNMSGDLNFAGRDIIKKETVMGDKIEIGDITGSTGVAIGRNNHVTVNQSGDTVINLEQAFTQIQQQVAALPSVMADPSLLSAAQGEIKDIKTEVLRGDEADEGFLARRFDSIKRTATDILDVVTTTLVNPMVGAATVVRKVAKKAREEAGLAPIE